MTESWTGKYSSHAARGLVLQAQHGRTRAKMDSFLQIEGKSRVEEPDRPVNVQRDTLLPL